MDIIDELIDRRSRPRRYPLTMRVLFVAWAVVTVAELVRKALG